MKIRFVIFRVTFFYTLLICSSCKQPGGQIYFNKSNDRNDTVTNISITELSRNYRSYQGKYIQTTGRFYRAFEVCCIGPLQNDASADSSFFWLHIPKDLDRSIPSIDKSKMRIVTIRGKIDTTRKGHLGLYPATITDIYYWQE